MFRASENGFSAPAFHAKCDNIPNTLTIVKTNFGKTIAAFTPLTWEGSGYKHDGSGKGFLLQVDLNNKYAPTRLPAYSVYATNGYGPTFGGGHDFNIANNANSGNNCYSNLLHSYVYVSGQQALTGQALYTSFVGNPSSYVFSTEEY